MANVVMGLGSAIEESAVARRSSMLGSSAAASSPAAWESFLGTPAVIVSAGMQQIVELLQRVAPTKLAVLVCGESGTGKELAARAVHHYSARSNRPYVEINCGALPEHLFESELFGYEKGAFSGAETTKPGLFEMAHGGTLFLDEVGELAPRVQVKLLRVLDGAPYYRLGGRSKVNVDVRIVAATNQDLKAAIARGNFRLDLFHRLAQVHVAIPPLRERVEDVLPLARFFLQQHHSSSSVTEKAAQRLLSYGWPGNVRELRNVIIRAALLNGTGRIEVEDLAELEDGGVSSAGREQESSPMQQPGACHRNEAPTSLRLDELERVSILCALQNAEGNRSRAAKLLGISSKTLSRKLQSYQRKDATASAAASDETGKERRQHVRKQASGTTLLHIEGPAGYDFMATLRDVSNSGFRAAHDNFSLSPGDRLHSDGALGHNRARVVWTRNMGEHVESGFVFLQPADQSIA